MVAEPKYASLCTRLWRSNALDALFNASVAGINNVLRMYQIPAPADYQELYPPKSLGENKSRHLRYEVLFNIDYYLIHSHIFILIKQHN